MKTDAQLQQDVMNELKWEPTLHAAEIGVGVKDGVVTLSGNVDSYAKKAAAEHAVKRVAGVKAVAEEIKVKLAGTLQALRRRYCPGGVKHSPVEFVGAA